MKVLIVEDEPALRELIQLSLEKERYVVETADGFNTALYKIEDYEDKRILWVKACKNGNAEDNQDTK